MTPPLSQDTRPDFALSLHRSDAETSFSDISCVSWKHGNSCVAHRDSVFGTMLATLRLTFYGVIEPTTNNMSAQRSACQAALRALFMDDPYMRPSLHIWRSEPGCVEAGGHIISDRALRIVARSGTRLNWGQGRRTARSPALSPWEERLVILH